MLLQHAWLAPLLKPDTIAEEDEEAAEAADGTEGTDAVPSNGTGNGDFIDREVGEWVIGALERKRTGKMGKSAKPALHAAPLDTVATPSPTVEKKDVQPVAVDA